MTFPKIKLTFKIISYIVVFIIGIVVASQFNCTGKPTQKCYNLKDSVVYSYKTHIDTIPFVYKEPIKHTGSNTKFDPNIHKECDEYRVDSLDLSDSLIEGNIVLGVKNNQVLNYSFVYTPLFPKYIHQIDSVEKTIFKVQIQEVPVRKNILYGSARIGTRESAIGLAFKTKKDYIFGYSFGMNSQEQKSHNIEVKIPIFKFGK